MSSQGLLYAHIVQGGGVLSTCVHTTPIHLTLTLTLSLKPQGSQLMFRADSLDSCTQVSVSEVLVSCTGPVGRSDADEMPPGLYSS